VFQTKSSRRQKYLWNLFLNRRSVREMRTFGFGEYISGRWLSLRDKAQEEVWKLEQRDARSILLCDALRIAGYIASLAIVLSMVLSGRVSPGVFAASVTAVLGLQNAARELLTRFAKIPELALFANDYFSFIDLACDTRATASGPPAPDVLISLEDVSFRYPDSDKDAVHGVSFTLRQGESVVVVGENGSGKTTLSKLLLGVYRPTRGRRKCGEFDISVVAQDFVRYPLTVRENIGISDAGRMEDDETMRRLLRDMSLGLPDLEQQMGREFGGMELSGGEWQRLAIARALFRGSPLIVLDEPTSNLDPTAENEILNGFVRAMDGRTTVIISHRTGLCRIAQRIVVMKDGEVVETGSHAELYTANGEYTRLFDAQAGWYRD